MRAVTKLALIAVGVFGVLMATADLHEAPVFETAQIALVAFGAAVVTGKAIWAEETDSIVSDRHLKAYAVALAASTILGISMGWAS